MFGKIKHLWVSLLAVLFVVAIAIFGINSAAFTQTVPDCPASYKKITWPANSPVWSLCWRPPNQSSGVDGSGLELQYVYYKNKKVLHLAHLPVLNVKYDPGGCGGSTLSYRDWQNQLQKFEANNVIEPGYAEPTVPPRTVCNNPGTDIGTFEGVAAEKKSDRLILTTQMPAGWYRYTQKWVFRPDGTIQPQFAFSAVTHPCTSKPHVHHAYWRFDFDIEGAANNRIDEFNNSTWSLLGTETSRNKSPGTSRKWRMVNQGTNRGYEMIPGSQDGVADSFAIADVWALRYQSNELDDGGAISGDDRAQMNKYINAESINGQDGVLWYHASFRHNSGDVCQFVGPTLKPIGTW